MKKLLCFLLVLIAVTGYAQDPMRFGSRGGGTFTGGTLTDNLIMSSGKYIGFGTGSLASLTLRLTGEAGTGVYFGTKLAVLAINNGEFIKVDGTNFYIQLGVRLNVGTAVNTPQITTGGLSYVEPTYTFNNVGKSGMSSGAIREASMVASGTESMRFLATGTYTPGFSQLGAGSPGLKCKLLTGTTASAVASSSYTAHGLDASKILSVTGSLVSGGAYFPPSYGGSPGYEYYVGWDATNIAFVNHPTNSTGILSAPFSGLIWYTE